MTNNTALKTRNNRYPSRTDYSKLVDNWFGKAFDTIFDEVDNDLFGGHLQTLTDENEDAYIIKAEVPGLSHDDINIKYENNFLTIQAEWKEDSPKGIRRGKVQKSYTVYGIDSDKIEAKLDSGILTLNLPKSEKAKPKRIDIK